ncbi:MAG TPA: NADH-quinone oxidoreductase subunit NuoE [Myxococcota bacterium]|nr:NADH-quinone oxidoreductase subunit NuoE [Myxococcota bacterium]
MSDKIDAGGAGRACVLIRGKPDADLLPCFERMRNTDGVRLCDAVIGDWDMLAVFQGPDRSAVDQAIERSLQALDEIDEYEVHHAENAGLELDLDSFIKKYEQAYVLVEIDSSRLDSLYAMSYFNENTVSCEMSAEGVMAVLLMQGGSIEEIKQSITRLQAQPGVLRVVTLQVVEILDDASPSVKKKTSVDAFGVMLWRRHAEQGMLIPLLQAVQASYGYITKKSIEQIAEATGTGVAEIYGVVTFYKQFRLTPLGRHIVRVCQGTACHVMGADFIAQTVEEELGVIPDETTSDELFTYMEVACLGCCSLGPVVMIDDRVYGRLTPQKLRTVLRKYRRQEKSSQAA